MASHAHGGGIGYVNTDWTLAHSSGAGYLENRQTTITGGSLPHTHGMSGNTGGASNLPPYCVLAFVMRVS